MSQQWHSSYCGDCFLCSVSDQGDHHLRLFGGSVDWEKASLISKLFSLYQGTVATPGKKNKPQVKRENTAGTWLALCLPYLWTCLVVLALSLQSAPQEHRSPVTLRVRLRIMPYLLKSTLAANSFPATVQVFIPIPLVSFQYNIHGVIWFHWFHYNTTYMEWFWFHWFHSNTMHKLADSHSDWFQFHTIGLFSVLIIHRLCLTVSLVRSLTQSCAR